MDMCVTSKSINEVPNSASGLKSVDSDGKAQKESTDLRQNNNAHLNHMSFIPVYTKKADMCPYFSDKGDENKSNSTLLGDQNQLKTSNSSSARQNYLAEQNEKLSLRSLRAHMRRRSVGFEDMTSMNACYISNEKRNGPVVRNASKAADPDSTCRKMLNSENDTSFENEKSNQKELSHMSMYNQNSKVIQNGNNQMQEMVRPYHQFKDKSSKRKSSLNRMDFIDFSTNIGNSCNRKSSYQSKDSSSDEEIASKPKQSLELSTNHCKRRHNPAPASGTEVSNSPQKPLNEVLHSVSPVNKVRLLPKSTHNSHSKLRQHKRSHSASLQLQKLSHSAGELESLTDEANATNKVCLSAQEFDSPSFSSRLRSGAHSKRHTSRLPPVNRSNSPLRNSNSDASQHKGILLHSNRNSSSSELINKETIITPKSDCNTVAKVIEENSSPSALMTAEPILSCMNLNDSFELKHIDSKSEDDLEVADSTKKLHCLEISEDISARVSDDNCDSVGSDGERRPSSILRRKHTEERKELHGILKPPADDKSSKTLPSILKHRESSEEKDVWQQQQPQPDLHSILKKSTSEDESCNSGPDIRPILKVSTDEDSPGGGSSKPRPILKKRTSFSEECCYASYPNNELRPILKKNAPILEDQPRPILKSRRKSEDARSSMSEFVASRPRAYSADMGVKSNQDRPDDVEQKSEDFCKRESQQL